MLLYICPHLLKREDIFQTVQLVMVPNFLIKIQKKTKNN
jgi:hypothetical protein